MEIAGQTMNVKTILIAAGMLLSLCACQPQPSHLDKVGQDSTLTGDSGAVGGVQPAHAPGKQAARQDSTADTTTASGALALRSLNGMALSEAMEIDDFRDRLEHDWGDVHSILLSSESAFAPEESACLVAKGEIKQGGFIWAAILIVDLHQDAVFAAQYDGENKVVNQFEEEKEGLRQPAPLTAWTAKYR
jgi:hypothetical protein